MMIKLSQRSSHRISKYLGSFYVLEAVLLYSLCPNSGEPLTVEKGEGKEFWLLVLSNEPVSSIKRF